MILEVPEDVYEPLVETAKQRGSTPEELAVEWLVPAIYKAMNDPVERFIGAFHSSIPDWADQHDKYLGHASMDPLHDAKDADL